MDDFMYFSCICIHCGIFQEIFCNEVINYFSMIERNVQKLLLNRTSKTEFTSKCYSFDQENKNERINQFLIQSSDCQVRHRRRSN